MYSTPSLANRPRFASQRSGPGGKAGVSCHSLVMNHAFVDGNKRVGHAAMETYLVLNGHDFRCGADEQEQVMLQLAAGDLSRSAFTEWVSHDQ